MQIALLTADTQLVEHASACDRSPLLGGRTLLHHQLTLALDAGCERIICLAERQPDEMEALRQMCSQAGVHLRLLHRPQELAAMVAATDRLFVIARNVVAEPDVLQCNATESRFILALPAEPAIAAGFERIDATRAWAGLMLVPGYQIEQLHQLPGDIEPASALLRIALMDGTPVTELPASVLAENRISLPRSGEEIQRIERDRLARLARPVGFSAPLRAVVERLALRAAPAFLASSFSLAGMIAAAGLLMLFAGFAAYSASRGVALGLMALVYATIAAIGIMRRVRGRPERKVLSHRSDLVMGLLADFTLIYILAGSTSIPIAGTASWFAPVMLVGLLHLADRVLPGHLALPLSDRMCLTMVLLVADFAGVLLFCVPVLSLSVLAVLFVYGTHATDITTN